MLQYGRPPTLLGTNAYFTPEVTSRDTLPRSGFLDIPPRGALGIKDLGVQGSSAKQL